MLGMEAAKGMVLTSDPTPPLDPRRTALLLVDLQEGTCGRAQPRPRPAFDGLFQRQSLALHLVGSAKVNPKF